MTEPQLTKKRYLEMKYIQFSHEIGEILGTRVFPSLDELCMIDILLFFQYTFWGTDDYRDIVRNIITTHHQEIDEETFNKIYPIVEKYVNDLKDFLKKN